MYAVPGSLLSSNQQTMFLPHCHGSVEITLLAIFGHQPADRRDRHQDRATDITGLPLHPVIVCGLNDRVALADRLVLIAHAVEQLAMLKISSPKVSKEMNKIGRKSCREKGL